MSNTEKFIGVRLNGGEFDLKTREYMSSLIKAAAKKCKPLNKASLGKELGMGRDRVRRITTALELTDLFN